MPMFDLMIFDLDGTLVDSAPDLVIAVNYTRRSLGLKSLADREITGFVGDGMDKLIERSLGPEFLDRYPEAVALFMAYYEEHLLDNTILYPDVTDILQFFGKKKKAIITNKRESFTRKITDHFDITGYFDIVIGLGTQNLRKPDARILSPVLKLFPVPPSHAIIFGDGVADINLARNGGMKSCALLNGYTPRETLLSLQPDFACEGLSELKTMFC